MRGSPSAGHGELRANELNTVQTRYGTGRAGRTRVPWGDACSVRILWMGEGKVLRHSVHLPPSLRHSERAPRRAPPRLPRLGSRLIPKGNYDARPDPRWLWLALAAGATPPKEGLSAIYHLRACLAPFFVWLLPPLLSPQASLSNNSLHHHVSFATDHSSQWGLVRATPWLVCSLSLLVCIMVLDS